MQPDAAPATDRPRPGRWADLGASIGPGIVWAATAVGVSHLVQSTRAGAVYGFGLVGVVLVANLLKYPFFEFGPRYAAATGESLLEGYQRLGRWAVVVYLVLTVGTVSTVVGAITFFTGSLATQLFGPWLSPLGYGAAFLALCAVLVVVGRYPLLDGLIKVVVAVMTVSTLVAVVAAMTVERSPVAGFEAPAAWSAASFGFLIALVGWMPSAVDISVWHSLWTLERARQTGHRPRLAEALADFNVGYVGTTVLALLFLSLGSLMLFGSGRTFPDSGPAFAAQLVEVYTGALGAWSRPVIQIAAFTTMFSTLLACVDAFPRVLARATGLLVPRWRASEGLFRGYLAAVMASALVVVGAFLGQLTRLVDFATTLSFLTSPILAWLNFRVVRLPHVPADARPGPWLVALSWAGLAFGVVFGGVFLVWRFA